MTDTAIPIPDDAQARIDQQAAQMRAAAERLTATLNAFTDDMVSAVAAAGRVWAESMDRSAARWRVREAMPTLTMREVLVHGYVAYKEA